MSFVDELLTTIEQGAKDALPAVQDEITKRINDQVRPAVVSSPQPLSTMTVAQAQLKENGGKIMTYGLIAAVAVGVYFLLKKRGK